MLHLVLAFFGLPPNHSSNIHTQIFEMCNYGNGFSMMELYKMPTYLRRFYYNKLVEAKEKENEASKQSTSGKPSKVRIKR